MLDIPVVAANMDTVCEAEMALALAELGGIGMIHRFLPIDDHAAQVRRVKEAGEGFQCGAAVGTDHDMEKRARALVACFVGATRLIDNRGIEII